MHFEAAFLLLVPWIINCNGQICNNKLLENCDLVSYDCDTDVLINVTGHQTWSKTSVCICKITACPIDGVEQHVEVLSETKQFSKLTSAINWILESKYNKITLFGHGNYTEIVAKGILDSDLPLITDLKLSNTQLSGQLKIKWKFLQLRSLDLSNNKISALAIDANVPVKSLNVSANSLIEISGLEHLNHLEILDLSDNFLSSELLKYFPRKIEHLDLRKNPKLISQLDGENFENEAKNEIGYLDLSNNGIKDMSDIYQIFVKFHDVEVINLSSNKMRSFHEDMFPVNVYKNTKMLTLSKNEITKIGPNTFSKFQVLHWLDLTDNLLQHLPIIALPVKEETLHPHDRLVRSVEHPEKILNATSESIFPNISLDNNPWSCDCFSADYHSWILTHNKTNTVFDIVCQNPIHVAGRHISGLNATELICINATAQVANSSYDEFTDAILHCNVTGAPLPIPYWISPENETISAELGGFDSNHYSISPDGQTLTVRYLRYHSTGKYRCVANNRVSHVHVDCTIGVILAPFGTVVAIVASSVSFFVAMLLNMVNLCHYMTDHFKKQKEKKKAQKKLEEEKANLENAKLREKEFYESAASLNANRYYGKYDFTCQQMFLDTVVKGAHSVKKTIYDAKNSEFSNNMWEYAAYLRDRLHIELPTVQRPRVPRVSMPTISMPNISIPSFQGINTNIEKIGTSVIHRSHKIGTSVGSVFTLRWLRNTNPSDLSSSDECEAGPSQQRVKVHVHHRHTSTESSYSSDNDEPPLLKQSKDEKGKHRRTKSVRFYKEDEEFIPSKPRRTASYSSANPTVDADVVIAEPEGKIVTVSHSVHEFETSL